MGVSLSPTPDERVGLLVALGVAAVFYGLAANWPDALSGVTGVAVVLSMVLWGVLWRARLGGPPMRVYALGFLLGYALALFAAILFGKSGGLLAAFDAHAGGVQAIVAVIGLAVLIQQTQISSKVLDMEKADRAGRRPWLGVEEVAIENVPRAGFKVWLRFKNYGELPASALELRAWHCGSDDACTSIRQSTSGNELVPTQSLRWPIECPNLSTARYLVVHLRYAAPDAQLHDLWLAYNWPLSPNGLGQDLVYADAGVKERLRVAVSV